MSVRTYNLFISHSWNYGKHYDNLIALLKRRGYFKFKDYSVPRDDPIHNAGTAAQLRAAIKGQMQPCNVVLIMAGVYANHSKWIKEEISLAKRGFSRPKPIIAIRPRGNKRMSAVVGGAANKTVRWNTESIVKAIRELR